MRSRSIELANEIVAAMRCEDCGTRLFANARQRRLLLDRGAPLPRRCPPCQVKHRHPDDFVSATLRRSAPVF